MASSLSANVRALAQCLCRCRVHTAWASRASEAIHGAWRGVVAAEMRQALDTCIVAPKLVHAANQDCVVRQSCSLTWRLWRAAWWVASHWRLGRQSQAPISTAMRIRGRCRGLPPARRASAAQQAARGSGLLVQGLHTLARPARRARDSQGPPGPWDPWAGVRRGTTLDPACRQGSARASARRTGSGRAWRGGPRRSPLSWTRCSRTRPRATAPRLRSAPAPPPPPLPPPPRPALQPVPVTQKPSGSPLCMRSVHAAHMRSSRCDATLLALPLTAEAPRQMRAWRACVLRSMPAAAHSASTPVPVPGRGSAMGVM